MKSVIIILLIQVFSFGLAVAQTNTLQTGDSTRITLERNALANELIHLRDSMSISLLAFDEKIDKTLPSKAKKLVAARKELSDYQDQIELDLEEVAATSINGWSQSASERIKLYAANTRKEFKRICLML